MGMQRSDSRQLLQELLWPWLHERSVRASEAIDLLIDTTLIEIALCLPIF